MEDNEHAALPTPKAKHAHFSFVFIARLSALHEAIADIPLREHRLNANADRL
jgi:hypothetical protein